MSGVLLGMSEHAPLCADFLVLDVASNGGNPAVPLAKALPHAQIVATDLSPVAVSFISGYAQAEGVTNVMPQPADAQNLEQFKDCTFAAVTCSYGLMFMPDHARALREAYRVLQPGGLYVATVWAPLDTFQFGQVSIAHFFLDRGTPSQHAVSTLATDMCTASAYIKVEKVQKSPPHIRMHV